MPPSSVVLRLGSHAEKDYVLKTASIYDGVIVGANLLEMTPGATASLAWKYSSLGRQFCIDPLTYVFALHPDYVSSERKDKKTGRLTKEMKKSFQMICNSFGGPFKDVALAQGRAIAPGDFSSPAMIEELAQCVLEYQLGRMEAICAADTQLQEIADQAKPAFVLSPYFYMPSYNEGMSAEWEAFCIDTLHAFGRLDSPVPKHGVICFSKKILRDRDRLIGIVRRAIGAGCDATWYWISDFREEEATPAELANLKLMIGVADSTDHPLYNLHGGFLSALLSKHGLHGFSHSVGYGESKDVFPLAGGALPTVTYHYTPLHLKSSVLDIERAFSSLGIVTATDFHEMVCDCSICTGTLRGNIRNFRKFGELVLKPGNSRESQTAESAKRCRFHFLLARRKELDFVNSRDAAELKATLTEVVSEYSELPPSIRLRERSDSLSRWIALL